MLISCEENDQRIYRRILGSIDKYKVIDAHEHQHRPGEYETHKFNFYHLLATGYLASDLMSAGCPEWDMNKMDFLSADKLWDIYGLALNFTRNTSYYSQHA